MIKQGQTLTGPQFNEPMRVETASSNGADGWNVGLVGVNTERFRRVTLTAADIADLSIAVGTPSFDGDGRVLRLGIQAYMLGIAYEFDPYFGLSISRVDPLPHQLEAVYEHLLKLPTVRFLLADDAGAGKTIMAGLLIRELKLRGLVERVLVVCPANLAFQWQREMREKFEETFLVFKGSNIRDQYGVNQWLEEKQVITSLDLAKRDDILPSLRQARWDLVIVDEAHRMSARDETHRSQRYRLGEMLRDSSDNILLLTATPHRGDPENFTLFLQLLDRDVYADVTSIKQAMDRQRAPFYLRRTKEAMVHFPEQTAEGEWSARPLFTKRIPTTATFDIDGPELELYHSVTRMVKRQSQRAAEHGNKPRARAVGFLMSLYQRRLASSTRAMRQSLENRAKRLAKSLAQAEETVYEAPPHLPDLDELEEMEDGEKEQLERQLEAVTLVDGAEQMQEEIAELNRLADDARAVEESAHEAKLTHLRGLLDTQSFFADAGRRLLVFTEFRDTLNYLIEHFERWGFKVGCIHGGMRAGSRDEAGTRLHAEQQFRDGAIQVLVATEAAGEGINLQCCNVLFNYDIPWNPNRLEQRMGRIHRYGQRHDCLIFNFVAQNTVEGKVLDRLLQKLQEIRNALDNDAVFNVVGEVLPSAQIERVLRDYYAGKFGPEDLEERMLSNVDEGHFRSICQTALESLAARKLNLEMLVERRARAKERRLVPESIARFMSDAAPDAALELKPAKGLRHSFQAVRVSQALRGYDRAPDWKLAEVEPRYPRLSTDRDTADKENIEWVTPGHPLFEALRRHALERGREVFTVGACFHSLTHDEACRLDFFRAQVVDGMGHVIRERLFAVEVPTEGEPRLAEPGVLGDMTPSTVPEVLPPVAGRPESSAWLRNEALTDFIDGALTEVRADVDRIEQHVEMSLTELLQRTDLEIGRATEDVRNGLAGAEGRLAQAEGRHDAVRARRTRRREDLARQRALTLQSVERLATALVLPHPDREAPELRRLRPHPETEVTAMRVVTEYEESQGRVVEDIHKLNLGYDLTSMDQRSGELRLIEVKGLANPDGTIVLTPNERRVAEDRPECYWLYVVVNCAKDPQLLEPDLDPARHPWHEVQKVEHYTLDVRSLGKH